jgi:hypothetical protein
MSPRVASLRILASLGQAHLLEVVLALCGDSLGLGLGQGGQQQRSQNGDDGNDHQQLNKGESPKSISSGL